MGGSFLCPIPPINRWLRKINTLSVQNKQGKALICTLSALFLHHTNEQTDKMNTTRELKNHKIMFLAMRFMCMVNEDSASPVFQDLHSDEEANEISFFASGSTHVAIELCMHICQLYNLTLHPSIDGSKILYTLMGN